MSGASLEEIKAMMVSNGVVHIAEDTISILDYPFAPSVAYPSTTIHASDIEDVDLTLYTNFKVGNELIFLNATVKEELRLFAQSNDIIIVDRPRIWEWILEPFLDTEFTPDTEMQLYEMLAQYGLSRREVEYLRTEVEAQMIKYNFDTMLWEWVMFDTCDVLKAMRTKYNARDFEQFYKKVMHIALLQKQ